LDRLQLMLLPQSYEGQGDSSDYDTDYDRWGTCSRCRQVGDSRLVMADYHVRAKHHGDAIVTGGSELPSWDYASKGMMTY